MEDLTGIIAVVMIFLIPIIAIVTAYKFKMRKLELDRQNNAATNDNDLKRQMGHLMNENELLKERLKSVELILSEFPNLSEQERRKLKINLDQEMTLEELEIMRNLDKNN